MATQTFTTTGTWTAPAGVTSVQAECWGGGGNGGGAGSSGNAVGSGGGGGGGAYAKKQLTVVPGNVYTVTVGTGGAPGGDTWFSTALTVLAKGATAGSQGNSAYGAAGTGGAAGSSIGDVTTSGSNGTTGSGNTASNGGASPNGGATKTGTTGTPFYSINGANGNAPGGGAVGGICDNNGTANGGTGANGQVTLTYYTDLYWVGGSGNWDGSTTTNWSETSGGTGGTIVPTSAQNVHFDANSGSGVVTITATANCNSLTCTGYTGTLTGSSALNIYGSLLLVSGMTYSVTGTITFSSTSTGMNITTAAKTLTTVVFNGVGGGWTFLDTPTITTSVTLTNGALNLGSTTMTLQGTGTVWSATGGTIVGGTSTIKLTDASSSAKTFAGGGLTYNNLWLTGSGTGAYTITGSNTFNDFKCDTPPHTINFTAGTYTRVSTFTVNGTAGNLMTLQSTSNGSKWFIAHTTGNITVCDYLSIKDCTAL